MVETEKTPSITYRQLTSFLLFRYTEIENAGKKIHELLQKNMEFFKADENTDTWKAYVDYIDEMIVDGFQRTIACSLKVLTIAMASYSP